MEEFAAEGLGAVGNSLLRSKGGVDTVLSHWSKLLEGVQESPQAFYASVTEAVKTREIPGATTSSVEWPEGGPGSANRLYLRVTRGADVIDVCGAPFGNGFFVSTWLQGPPPSIALALIALVGAIVIGAAVWKEGTDFLATGFLLLDLLFILGVVALGIVRPLFFPPRPTFYRVDTANMFYTAVQ